MKGRSRTHAEIEFHNKLADIGCIACRQDGVFNPWVSIHHIDGRTKDGAHWKVLPLCAPHHQQDDASGVWAVHPYKARFEQEYGTQEELLEECKQILKLA
jgi:hypothetical protein